MCKAFFDIHIPYDQRFDRSLEVLSYTGQRNEIELDPMATKNEVIYTTSIFDTYVKTFVQYSKNTGMLVVEGTLLRINSSSSQYVSFGSLSGIQESFDCSNSPYVQDNTEQE